MWTPSFFYRFLSKEARTKTYIELVERGGFTLARKLLKRGIDVNNALAATLLNGTPEMVVPLLKAGAHVNSRPEDRNALLLASQSTIERKRKLKLLIEAGANVNSSVAPSLRTLLTHAVLNQDETFARFLVQHGADVNRPDYHGLTPMKLARMTGQTELVHFLGESGARSEVITCADVEKTFLMSRALWSQLHEILKAALSGNGFVIDQLELEWPAEDLIVRYHIRVPRTLAAFILRLEVLLDEKITLLLFDTSRGSKCRDLLPPGLVVDGATLRAYANTRMSELRAWLQGGSRDFFAAAEARPCRPAQAAVLRLSMAERAAYELLELPAGTPPNEVQAAYRRLAKRFHPDVAKPDHSKNDSGDKMRALNEAYQLLKS